MDSIGLLPTDLYYEWERLCLEDFRQQDVVERLDDGRFFLSHRYGEHGENYWISAGPAWVKATIQDIEFRNAHRIPVEG